MFDLQQSIQNGTGLYTLAEAASYARMHPATLSRWFNGNSYGNRVFPTIEPGIKAINFTEFVQVLAVRNLRVHYRIPLQKIRDAVEKAKKDFNLDYPFARRHTTFLFDRELWINLEDTDEVVQLSGKAHGQKGIRKVIEPFLKDVSFDETSGLANKYQAFARGDLKIVMDPKFRFGEPMLASCGYTPEALFEAALTEGSAEAAAEIYGVTPAQVEICIDYFDYLRAA